MPPPLAVMMAVPVPTPVARPCEPAELLIVATELGAADHETMEVTFDVEPSEKVAVAVNCWVRPLAIDMKLGLTLIEIRLGARTVSVALSDLPPYEAVMVVMPTSTPVARPCEPAELLIVATKLSDENQVTSVVRFCDEPSE